MHWLSIFSAVAAGIPVAMMSVAGLAGQLKTGDAAPDFKLPGSDGKTYHLADFRGKQAVVLAWFPKAFTPGCTAECKSFAAGGNALRKFDAVYFTASCDTAEKNRKFAESSRPTFRSSATPTASCQGVWRYQRDADDAAAMDVLHRQGRQDTEYRQVGKDLDPRGRRCGEVEGIGRGGEDTLSGKSVAASVPLAMPVLWAIGAWSVVPILASECLVRQRRDGWACFCPSSKRGCSFCRRCGCQNGNSAAPPDRHVPLALSVPWGLRFGQPLIISSNSASVITGTPIALALSSLLPAFSPATT